MIETFNIILLNNLPWIFWPSGDWNWLYALIITAVIGAIIILIVQILKKRGE